MPTRIEHWWFTVPLRLKSLLRRGRVEQDLDEELQFHLENKIAEGVASGLSPDAARRAALRDMGGLDQHKELARDVRGVRWLTDLFDDVRYAIRSLRRARGLTAFVVIALAMGIGMTAASFSMVDALVFRPYPVKDPGRVVNLLGTTHDAAYEPFSYREYVELRDRTKSYDGVIASAALRPVGYSPKPDVVPRIKGGMMVSANYFRVLGVEPYLGRGFRAEEDQVPGRDAVVVLGRDFWKNEFASDPHVLGRTIRLNGREFVVIGVTPESFPGMYVFMRPDFYVSLAMAPLFTSNPQKNFFEDRGDRQLTVRARLKPGASLAEARSEIAALANGFEREHPEFHRNRGARVLTQFELRTRGDDVNWKFGVIFTVLALAVLLVACTNVAGLLLSRALSRRREIAVRLALGAGRSRVIRLLLTESLILALLGGLAGVVVGFVAIESLRTFRIPAELPVTVPFRMDARVLVACLAMSVVSAILCGLAPALQSARRDLVHGLKSGDVDATGRGRMWGRNVLVVAQVSTSLMLLTAAFLMARSFQRSVVDTSGFSKDHLLMARFDPRLVQYDSTQTQQFYQRLTERARAMSGVRSAALTQNPPLGLDPFDRLAFVPENHEMPPGRESVTSTMDTVDEGFFETMGIAILAGRGFRAADTGESPRVAVVNEQFAKHYWPDAEPLGKRIRLDRAGGTPVEIVGVARTIKYAQTTEQATDMIYLPLSQRPVPRMVMMLKTEGDPLTQIAPLKDVVQSLDSNLPIVELRTYEDLYRYNAVEGPRVAVDLVTTMGVMALLLAIAGLYGLVAYNVTRRTREIGIRMAIGATPRDIQRLVIGKGLALVGLGTAIGLAMGIAVERLMNSMIFNVGGMDFLAYAIVVPAMFVVTLLAAWIPARRASRIEPTEALRYE